jgi:hypothetical protein
MKMSKIEVEDLTVGLSEEQKESNTIILANGLVQAAGRGAIAIGLTLRHAALSLFAAGEILLIVGEKAGKISADEFENVRDTAMEYAGKQKELLKKTGIMDLIEAVKSIKPRGQG